MRMIRMRTWVLWIRKRRTSPERGISCGFRGVETLGDYASWGLLGQFKQKNFSSIKGFLL